MRLKKGETSCQYCGNNYSFYVKQVMLKCVDDYNTPQVAIIDLDTTLYCSDCNSNLGVIKNN